MELWRDFHGVNAAYVLELYERYQQDPRSVDPATRERFAGWSPTELESLNGSRPSVAVQIDAADGVAGTVNLAQSIRGYGHLAAQLDPIGREPPGDPALELATHGLNESDLQELPASLIGGVIGREADSALHAIQKLHEVYCTRIGYDNDHIHIPEERNWLRDAAESCRYRPAVDRNYAFNLLDRLTQVEVFEQFLQQTFPSKYRFSVEGLDILLPMLDELIVSSAERNVSHILMGMSHRGRLNVLAHILHKPYEQILAEFKDPLRIQKLQDAIGWTTGDVKYHRGTRRMIKEAGGNVVITMPPNSSHLELINPIILGMARAAGTRIDQPGQLHFDPKSTLQILIHGDAAFPAQGIMAEALNLSHLPGYRVGGTVHIIANNQIGFTTLPEDGRSTNYASDLAKGFNIPIVHVNADDPEACIEVARIAWAYQEKFEKDFLIDLIGYRRYGHNELDEPSFTQPLMYETIRAHPSVRKLWAGALIERGMIEPDKSDALTDKHNAHLREIYESLEDHTVDLFDPPPPPPQKGEAARVETAVNAERLREINDALRQIPDEFKFFSKRLEKAIRGRRESFDHDEINWATAEELAFASILAEGIPIRLTGQDSERGTFSQRHAVLHDAENGSEFVPLQEFTMARAAFEIHDSPLSEAAALGFEYGYNAQQTRQLVIWEAQYGDFINNAWTIIDEYVTSAREKWGQTSSLVMLLPHGWEGAGPDHSSGRLERWLQLAARTNIRIANCTTAAGYFHLLRRQALLLESDPLPLVVLTPKSLLRHPDVTSPLADFTEGKWLPVVGDPRTKKEKKSIRRLVLCSGKLYIDLMTSDLPEQHPDVAIARVEQLYPFPIEPLKTLIDGYPNLQEVIWAQEEPKNMGAWEFIGWRLERLVKGRLPVHYVGRRRSPNPAEGSLTAHKTNQSKIIDFAFTYPFDASGD